MLAHLKCDSNCFDKLHNVSNCSEEAQTMGGKVSLNVTTNLKTNVEINGNSATMLAVL